MKKERFHMAAKMILFAAILVLGFSLNAFAAADPAATALLYTYYDVRSNADGGLDLTDNYFTVTNTDTVNWVQAHVRIRTGDKSVELLDFDVLLSPADVFAFDLYLAANGGIEFASCDTKTLQNSGFTTDGSGCIVMNSVTNSNMLSLIKTCQGVDDAGALLKTLKGYVEIIGEGQIIPDPADKNKCFSWVAGANQNIPNRTINNIIAAPNSCVVADVANMGPVLEGKVYYVTVDSDFSVQRLSYLNAEALDNALPLMGAGSPYAALNIIHHADNYPAELTRCAADPGCFAFVGAFNVATPNAAQDMNFCFYQHRIAANNDVINRFGAAATFGPMIADLNVRRTGARPVTAAALNTLEIGYSRLVLNSDMGPLAIITKTNAQSHYFYVPAPASTLDMMTKFAFIFPFQHYINEADAIAVSAIYDMEENTTTTPLTKFISPGLPTVSSPGEEAAIFAFTPPFAEGWVSFTPTATNATCPPGVSDATDDVRCTGAAYTPGYTAAVFTTGANALGSSHMNYR